MIGKRPSETSVCLSQVMLPEDTNPAGNVHGGVILKHIDTTAGVVAMRHARCNVGLAQLVDADAFPRNVAAGLYHQFKTLTGADALTADKHRSNRDNRIAGHVQPRGLAVDAHPLVVRWRIEQIGKFRCLQMLEIPSTPQ